MLCVEFLPTRFAKRLSWSETEGAPAPSAKTWLFPQASGEEHELWCNPLTGHIEAVPRHQEIPNHPCTEDLPRTFRPGAINAPNNHRADSSQQPMRGRTLRERRERGGVWNRASGAGSELRFSLHRRTSEWNRGCHARDVPCRRSDMPRRTSSNNSSVASGQ
jgi:hypothetical protein